MNDAQIQRAANDADGSSGWSPEVRWLAAEVLRLRRTVENYEETGARTRARAERAEDAAAGLRQTMQGLYARANSVEAKCQEGYAAALEVVRSLVDPGTTERCGGWASGAGTLAEGGGVVTAPTPPGGEHIPRCPFCGDSAGLVATPGPFLAAQVYRVRCETCGVSTPPKATRWEALDVWRRRQHG